ncbi:ras association domain-containing protein 10 [Syngnathus typhle]|uniref:ras association domain-containing protein 10 n=1 Tax=Syngnathus typhle TaxID=161592 RepID=UPI002A6A9553|nr:ras association domain-containing protein 10 [Syngnathus typhle]XP_061132075.1 ras association domain-containing protein 10 [Syngnathus typhle]
MDSVERRISVWVCAEEKFVVGLSKRTTCADVVKALLEDLKQPEPMLLHRYCIVEKWRGLQRILPDRTRIWRLWVAWGEERDRVRFVLVGFGEAARSAEARVVLLGKPNLVSKWTPDSSLAEVSPHKQRRIVRKAFRKLEKMQQRKQPSSSGADKMQAFAHLVVSQDRTIRLQAHRIQQLDAEIGRRESKVHLDRTLTHGVNYVQNTHLFEDAAAEGSSQEPCSLEGLLHLCDVMCQGELWEQELLTNMFTMQMKEALNHHWTQGGGEDSAFFITGGDEMFLKERLRRLLDATLDVGRRLHSDLEAIRGDLELSRQICSSREEEMRDLLEKINSLGSEDGADTEGGTDEAERMRRMMSSLERKREWVEQARGLSKCHRGNDDDSDTGLSSLHSQESDSLTVCQSLV